MTVTRELQSMLHLFQLGLPAHELSQSAPRRHLQACAQRSKSCHLENFERIVCPFNARRSQRSYLKVALGNRRTLSPITTEPGLASVCKRAASPVEWPIGA